MMLIHSIFGPFLDKNPNKLKKINDLNVVSSRLKY